MQREQDQESIEDLIVVYEVIKAAIRQAAGAISDAQNPGTGSNYDVERRCKKLIEIEEVWEEQQNDLISEIREAPIRSKNDAAQLLRFELYEYGADSGDDAKNMIAKHSQKWS